MYSPGHCEELKLGEFSFKVSGELWVSVVVERACAPECRCRQSSNHDMLGTAYVISASLALCSFAFWNNITTTAYNPARLSIDICCFYKFKPVFSVTMLYPRNVCSSIQAEICTPSCPQFRPCISMFEKGLTRPKKIRERMNDTNYMTWPDL